MDEKWPPHVLRDYSFIADSERGALIGPDGVMTWPCPPTRTVSWCGGGSRLSGSASLGRA